MIEVVFQGAAAAADEATIQNWFVEEGDLVNEGDDLVELSTADGKMTITAPSSGILAEVYYDEGEVVGKGEVLCSLDDEDSDGGAGDDDEE